MWYDTNNHPMSAIISGVINHARDASNRTLSKTSIVSDKTDDAGNTRRQ